MRERTGNQSGARAPTESSVVWEEILNLRRAFKATIRKCERATNEQEQREAIRELGRLTRQLTKTAKPLASQPKYAIKVIHIMTATAKDAFALSRNPVLSKFGHQVGN